MLKKNNSSCLHLPLHNIRQKIYDLGPKFCIALIKVKIEEPRELQLHIKLVEIETNRYICMHKALLQDLVRQLRQFESVNIEYPCANVRDSGLSVKETSNPGEYQIAFEKTKLVLDPTAVTFLFSYEESILDAIRNMMQHHIRGGYDMVG